MKFTVFAQFDNISRIEILQILKNMIQDPYFPLTDDNARILLRENTLTCKSESNNKKKHSLVRLDIIKDELEN